MKIQRVLYILTLGALSSYVSAGVIYSNTTEPPSNDKKPFKPEFSYPLKHSEIRITNNDEILRQYPDKDIGKLILKEPSLNIFNYDTYDREVYALVQNKVFSEKLTLTVYTNQETGKIEYIESKTIPLIDVILDISYKIVQIIKLLLPLVAPIQPSAPTPQRLEFSDQDKIINSEQCIQFDKSIIIKVPKNLPNEAQTYDFEGSNGKKCITVNYKEISNYSIKYDNLNGIDVGNNLLSSTCREVEITIAQTENRKYNFKTTIADSNFLQRTAIPKNGIMIPEDCTWQIQRKD